MNQELSNTVQHTMPQTSQGRFLPIPIQGGSVSPSYSDSPDPTLRSLGSTAQMKISKCIKPRTYLENKERRTKKLVNHNVLFQEGCCKCLNNPTVNGFISLIVQTLWSTLFIGTLSALFTALLVDVVHRAEEDQGELEAGSGVGTLVFLSTRVYSDSTIGVLSTAVAFLVVTRLQENVAQNRKVFELFFGLCGTTCAIAIECRSLTDPAAHGQEGRKRDTCSKMARVLASIPYALIDKFRNADHFEHTLAYWEEIINEAALPLFDQPDEYDVEESISRVDAPALPRSESSSDRSLRALGLGVELPEGGAWSRETLLSDDVKKVRELNLPVYESLLVLLTMYVDAFEQKRGESSGIAPPKVGFLVGAIRRLTNDEGHITGILAFRRPSVLNVLMYVVLFGWYLLLILSKLIPENRYHSIWLSSFISLTTLGFYTIAEDLKNPFGSINIIPAFCRCRAGCFSNGGPAALIQQREIAHECQKTESMVMAILGTGGFSGKFGPIKDMLSPPRVTIDSHSRPPPPTDDPPTTPQRRAEAGRLIGSREKPPSREPSANSTADASLLHASNIRSGKYRPIRLRNA